MGDLLRAALLEGGLIMCMFTIQTLYEGGLIIQLGRILHGISYTFQEGYLTRPYG